MSSIIDRANRDYGALTLTVSLPQPVGQFMDALTIKRLLTLKPLEDFADLSGKQKILTVLKVIIVGFISLGIGAAVTLASPVALWSIPLATIVAMGLSFNFITYEKSGREMLEKMQQEKKAALRKDPAEESTVVRASDSKKTVFVMHESLIAS